ncbi:hypothetical protein PG993_009604 [Apiospora rasikravindrae]|uniref:Uncharacterized protein n=1 Tax=Apiospora rasikravindrae TaxID=990691 RepID=A0ABR1SLN4_9PEZI
MRFLSSLAIFLATAQAAVTADELIKTLNGFKDVATDLQGDARKVNVDDCEFYDQGKRPLNVLVGTIGFAVQQATEFAGKLGGSPNYCGARADDVLKAYGGFADAHHRLFNILSHKTEEVAPRRWETYPEAGDAVVSALTDVRGVGKVSEDVYKKVEEGLWQRL